MKRIWHLAQKDLRRLAWPVALWVAFIVGSVVWFRFARPAPLGEATPAFIEWVAVMQIWTNLILGGWLVVGIVLVGALVTEDPLVGATPFWPTRPISGARLLAAKLLSAAILFLLAPAAALAVVWQAEGFPLGETLTAFGRWMTEFGLVLLFSLTIGALSRSLAQFLFLAVAFCVGVLALGCLAAEIFFWNFRLPQLPPLRAYDRTWIELLSWGLFGVALLQRYLRRSSRAWLTVGCGVPLLVAFSTWASNSPSREAALEAPPPSVALTVKAAMLGTHADLDRERASMHANLTFQVAPARNAEVWVYAPAEGALYVHWDGAPRVKVELERGSDWGHGVALSVVRGEQLAPRWNFHGTAHRAAAQGADMRISGVIEIWEAEPLVLGELRMERGAEIVHGGSRTRVIGVDYPPGWECVLVLEERDSWLIGRHEFLPEKHLNRGSQHYDVFVLVNRAAGKQEVLGHTEHEVVTMHQQVVGFRRIQVPPAKGEYAWRRDAVIVKVRLKRRDSFWMSFEENAPVVREGRPL